MLFLGRSTGLATLAILLPATKGNKKIGFTVWNVVTYLLMSIIMVIMVGVLGNAIQTQMFPIYTLLHGLLLALAAAVLLHVGTPGRRTRATRRI